MRRQRGATITLAFALLRSMSSTGSNSLFAGALPTLTNVAGPTNPPLFWFSEVVSTMDTAKDLIKSQQDLSGKLWGVQAGGQTGGRGTRGRTWVDGGGNNLFLTLVVPRAQVPAGLPLTLVPLRIGTILQPSIASRTGNKPVLLKWPNDIIIEDKKVSGILIEWEGDNLLIGVGVNVFAAPQIISEDNTNANYGRPATSISQHNPTLGCDTSAATGEQSCLPSERIAVVQQMGREILGGVEAWLTSADSAEAIVSEFTIQMQTSKQTLRESGEEVEPIKVNTDGTLLVRHINNGTESRLIAEYLY